MTAMSIDLSSNRECRLAPHIARASKLHTHLVATVVALDSERHVYAEEISEERRQRVVLRGQVRAAKAE